MNVVRISVCGRALVVPLLPASIVLSSMAQHVPNA